ncbi:MAG: tRNA pseudouridine(13) synthase TruD, partial [Promethearchaeia archaeon]
MQRTDEILNWNPAMSLRVHDQSLGLTCFVRPLRRGIGGVIRYQWHDFRVTERRLSDGSLAELTDMDSIPRGAPQRFLSAVLYKVGRDTFEIVAKIARHLGIAKERIGFAGLKDRAAVTMQEISIDAVSPGGISPKRVLSLNRDLVRAAIGNLRWTSRALHFGEHAGNHFCLVIRQVEAEAFVIKKAVSSLKRRGFINYFGHQRFGLGGGSGLSAVAVGKALVMGHYRQAATCIMSDDDACSPEEAAAKRVWRERGDERAFLEASLQACARRRGTNESSPDSRSHRGVVPPTDASAECGGASGAESDEARRAQKREAKERRREKRAMLESDTFSAEDFRAGCDAMPHRYIYMQSFWSLLWNQMVSLWVRGHGLRHVKEGDLVLVATSRRAADAHKKLDDIHVVTAAEARRGVFGLKDLVLPLPGPGVEMQWPRDEQLQSQLEGVLQGAGVAALVRHR